MTNPLIGNRLFLVRALWFASAVLAAFLATLALARWHKGDSPFKRQHPEFAGAQAAAGQAGATSAHSSGGEVPAIPPPPQAVSRFALEKESRASQRDIRSMACYDTPLSPDEVRDFYRKEMAQAGWQEWKELDSAMGNTGSGRTIAYRRAAGSVLINIQVRLPSGSAVFVSACGAPQAKSGGNGK